MSVVEVTGPSAEPVTYEETRDHINLEHDDDYDLITRYIKSARRVFENKAKHILVQRTFDYSFSRFPFNRIVLPRNPVISITSITYIDLNLSPTSQTVATSVYELNAGVTPAHVYLKYNQKWPSNRGWENDVTVRFVAGYNDDGDSPRDYAQNVPDDIKVCIMSMVGEMYKNRDLTIDVANYRNEFIDSLIEPHVFYRL